MTKRMIKNASYEGERPLFASRHLRLEDVIIYPGESALKECSDIEAVRCEFRGKYPFWHNDGLLVEHCLFREGAPGRHLVFPESAHEGYPRGSAQDVP